MALPIIPMAMSVAKLTAAAIGANAANTAMSSLFGAVKNGTSVGSLADLSRPFRVEPLVLVDQTLQNQPFMEDVMKMGLTQFTAYYLQAFSALMNVGRIDTLRVFDSLNPHRSVSGAKEALLKGTVLSQEDWDKGLPSLEDFEQAVRPGLLATYESVSQEDAGDDDGKKSKDLNSSAKLEGKLYEVESLSVGKLVNVELKSDKETAKVPVLIRLISTAVKPEILTHIFTAGGRDSFGERFQLARAGMIRPVRDLIFGIDLLDEHRRALMNDTSGAYKAITDRRRNNVKKAAMSGVLSAADASNIAVVSSDTAKEMSRRLFGKLEHQAVRERMFNNSYLLLLIVVNEKWEKVTVYHRGLDLASEYSFKDIKASERGKGQDITELFKIFHGATATANV